MKILVTTLERGFTEQLGAAIINLNFILDPASAIKYNSTNQRTLIRITDILGRETNGTRNKFLFYIFDDGTVEKKIIMK